MEIVKVNINGEWLDAIDGVDAAQLTGYSRAYFYLLRDSGKIRATKGKGKQVYFILEDIQKLLRRVKS